jgi:hypothetical protein
LKCFFIKKEEFCRLDRYILFDQFPACGVWIEVDTQNGKATAIQRVMVFDDEVHVGKEDE